MLRYLKVLAVLAVLAFVGLVGYAYLGDLSPQQDEIRLPIEIDGE